MSVLRQRESANYTSSYCTDSFLKRRNSLKYAIVKSAAYYLRKSSLIDSCEHVLQLPLLHQMDDQRKCQNLALNIPPLLFASLSPKTTTRFGAIRKGAIREFGLAIKQLGGHLLNLGLRNFRCARFTRMTVNKQTKD